MKRIDKLDVLIGEKQVGTLAETKDGLAAFQYSDQWLSAGYALNPFSLPLAKKVFLPNYDPFEGIFGVFADSLPDGWGRLLVDRYLKKTLKVNVDEISNFYRLTFVSDAGMGALSYQPSQMLESHVMPYDYDTIALECKKLLEQDTVGNLDELFLLGGSSGGARPKILTEIDSESWIIKFPSSYDDLDIGLQEYEYSLCAKACGLEMSETRLFASKECAGYFGTKRFDRRQTSSGKQRIHMVSLSGMLETSHRIPNMDYNQLMRLTMLLTNDMREVEKMFSFMCFNVFAHNRDDHSKNVSFLYDEQQQRWKMAPVYDLTYSNSIGGEHATTIDGEGKRPGMENILSVAKKATMDCKRAKIRAAEIRDIVRECLGKYLG
ncbi:type II toxin-antitoxin system HipA family toxin [Hominibacterium faecale]|uniref:type II toxin-antitoxin system HipA family toxin n=1 Tax=Hominibacterium faecale TaxID=2839743 RepID=UPI0022B2A157|nr:type II toxin-antitoxin system HipA family toxin [Hominibacterium faecale]